MTKGNGFYDRKLATPVGSLEISVPRTRTGNFDLLSSLTATKELIVRTPTFLCL